MTHQDAMDILRRYHTTGEQPVTAGELYRARLRVWPPDLHQKLTPPASEVEDQQIVMDF